MTVQLPPAFQFSQSSLQDFADCARRFQLRYLMQQEWPAPIVEPLTDAEQADSLGKRFHKLMERYWLGLPIERDKIDPSMYDWWDIFKANPPANLPEAVRRPEVHTTAVIGGQRFTATYDLLAYTPGGDAVIMDWKTARHRPRRSVLDRRLQTLLYPLLLVESAQRLLGYAVKPEQVQLMYWFTATPTEPEIFQYSAARCEQDKATVTAMVERLMKTSDAVWPLTPNEQHCRWCQYRSLCERGVEAGTLDELNEPETTLEIEAATNLEAVENAVFDKDFDDYASPINDDYVL